MVEIEELSDDVPTTLEKVTFTDRISNYCSIATEGILTLFDWTAAGVCVVGKLFLS